MATANCQNDSCEKGEWTLRKHPDDYARGVNCPECGSSNVDVEIDDADRDRRAPDTREPSRARPATQEAPPAVDRGIEGGDAIFELLNYSSRGQAIQGIGAALLQYGDREERRRAQERERAQSVEEVRRPENFPTCPECDTTIRHVPEEGQLFCPGCGIALEAV